MNPYITFRDEENEELRYYILQREFPHIICYVSPIPIKMLVGAVAVSGYNLWIVFDFTLRGKSIPSYRDIDKEIVDVMISMGEWYLRNRILIEPKKYKKFKLDEFSR